MRIAKQPEVAQVVIPIPVDTPFSYLIPEAFEGYIQPGVQVIVPFGERYLAGIVLRRGEAESNLNYQLKPIYDIVRPEPFVGNDILKLLEWIRDYYVCHLGEAYRLINPAINLHKTSLMLKKKSIQNGEKLTEPLTELLAQLSVTEWCSIDKLEKILKVKNLLYRAHRLKELGCIETCYLPPKAKKIYKILDLFELQPEKNWEGNAKQKYNGGGQKKYERAYQLMAFLQENGSTSRDILQAEQFSSTLLKRLENEGVIQRSQIEVCRELNNSFREENKIVQLTEEQRSFINTVSPFIEQKPTYKAFLLHGVTGSGKTQIYIQLIRKVLAQGKQAIVLIPEIILTPQTMARFQNCFGEQTAMLHSRLSAAEKAEVLQKIREDKFSIVIGPRSAIFSPFKQLGLIVIDEEHESSYKQSDAVPRYNARDVGLYRAYLNNIPIVLGSATPSFESLYNARQKKYEYFCLSKRANQRKLPKIQLVDCKKEWKRVGRAALFSENLLLKMEARLLTREQGILLQNRRGFSPYLLCKGCGYIAKCQHCDITLTFHSTDRSIRCHYCGYRENAPDVCPDCKGFDILHKGVGTQKIEEEANEQFPHARILRLDQDTTRKKGDYAKILEKFRLREADFLVGTKMIAKGLDFERVTLAGIMNADQGLHFPDFRATEKVFQLLIQAAGRSGRGQSSGEVVVQTFDPEHYIFKYLLKHDYSAFYHKELEARKILNYPPFSRLCLIKISGVSEQVVEHFSKEIAQYLQNANPENTFTLLGPAPAPLFRINDRYRYQILIKQGKDIDPSMNYLRHVLKAGIYRNPEIKKWPVQIEIDIDPLEIL